jgi:hypothetical protein
MDRVAELMAVARIGSKRYVSTSGLRRRRAADGKEMVKIGAERDRSDRSADGGRTDFGETFRVHDDKSGRPAHRLGVLTPRRRRWAWVAFVALLLYAPVEAYLVNGPLAQYTMPSDSWLLSATVAGLVGFVLIVDDIDRRKEARAPTPVPDEE